MIIGSMCAGSVRCYAAMLKAGKVVIDATEQRLPLRHSHHRYIIDAPNGTVKLTVPLEGSSNAMPVMMKDVNLSEHGNWRHLHWGALFSSYGKSPFFDFIAQDLRSIIVEGKQSRLLDLNMQLHNLIVDRQAGDRRCALLPDVGAATQRVCPRSKHSRPPHERGQGRNLHPHENGSRS